MCRAPRSEGIPVSTPTTAPRSVRRSPRLALHTQSRQRIDDSIDDRGLAAVSFDRSRFCVKRVSYADLRSEDPCLRAVDAMNQEFLEHTGENSSALSQSIAIPSKSTRWSSAFVAAVPRGAPGGCARARDGLVGARPDDWDRLRPRCRRLNFWCVDARHPSRRDVPALESISMVEAPEGTLGEHSPRHRRVVRRSGVMASNIEATATRSPSWEDGWARGSS
jgi:hypothetical protein